MLQKIPSDKTPDLDGFTARFLQAAWPIIDVMSVFDAFYRLGIINLHDLNGALLVLLPKSKEATSIRLSPHCSDPPQRQADLKSSCKSLAPRLVT
jgi:hypothetical protein